MTRFFSLAFAGLLLISRGHAAMYYVSPNGSDSNSGSQDSPYRTISRGVAAASSPGDTVIVMDGIYDNEGRVANPDGTGSVVRFTRSGTPGNPIVVMAQNRGKAILNAASPTQSSLGCYSAWAYFDVGRASYLVIQGFVIENGCINGIRANGTSHDITLRWNEIRNIGNWNNPAGRLSPSGIYLNSSEYNYTFDGNSFHDIGGSSQFYEHGLYTSASNVLITNNIFYNNTHGWAIQVAGGKNVVIANNTFAFPNPVRQGHIILWDNGVLNSLSNIVIQNNVFHRPYTYAVLAELDVGGSIDGCLMQYNLTTTGSIFDNGAIFTKGGQVKCTLTDNHTGTDALLMNVSNSPYDFHLQTGSPAIGAGVPVPDLGVDFDGTPRLTPCVSDSGAYAFVTRRYPLSDRELARAKRTCAVPGAQPLK